MNGNISEIIKPASALIMVTIAAAALLGYVHTITMEPITAQQLNIETEAIGAIFDQTLDTSKEVNIPINSPIKRALEVYSEGKPLGYAIFTSPSGYSGPVNIVVGVSTDGVVGGVMILEHSETPGLGANANSSVFTDQYKGKSGKLRVTKSTAGDDEIQAITSATITTNAVTKGVNDALDFYRQSLAK